MRIGNGIWDLPLRGDSMPLRSVPIRFAPVSEAGCLTVWTVYRHPNDYPGYWVMRAHEIFLGGKTRPYDFCFVASTLDAIRAKVPPGTWCIGRGPKDDPAIYESWVVEAPGSRPH
jgi:hypothetical protein